MAAAPRTLAGRLHSISGVVPVGVFLAFHLYSNAEARRGADAYNALARRIQGTPALLAIELLLVAAPLLFHGIYGLFRIADEAPTPAGTERLPPRARRRPAGDGRRPLRLRVHPPLDGAPRPDPRSREPRSLPPHGGGSREPVDAHRIRRRDSRRDLSSLGRALDLRGRVGNRGDSAGPAASPGLSRRGFSACSRRSALLP